MNKFFLIVGLCIGQVVLLAQEFAEKTITISLDLTRSFESNTLPEIHWLSPSLEHTGSPTPEIAVEALIDSHHAISEIKLIIKRGEQSKVQTVNIADNEFLKSIALKTVLFEGENEIILTVANKEGGKVSTSRFIKVDPDILTKRLYSNRKDYALIFASDRYESWSGLSSPVAGAEALADLLKTEYGFETELLKNPTLKDIQSKVAEYESKSYSSQDQLFIYFAGHCYFDNLMGFGYIVASNSAKNDLKKASYLSLKNMRTTLNDFKCQHILLAADVCCADLADAQLERKLPDGLTPQGVVDKLGIQTRKFINSGTAEFNDNSSGRFAPFTAQLIESLKQNLGPRKVKTFTDLNFGFKNLGVYSGGFGLDEPQSEFLFMPR